jgi:hypothetical protein
MGSHLKYTFVHDLVLDVEFPVRYRSAKNPTTLGVAYVEPRCNFKGTVVALVDPKPLEHLVESTSPSESWNPSRGRCNASD